MPIDLRPLFVHGLCVISGSKESVAVLGLGLIGSIWAGHLDRDGVLAATWNRTPKVSVPKPVASPREAAERANTLIIVVADPPAVERVIGDIEDVLGPRHVVIQSSTIGPADSRRFRDRVKNTGARYLEAPFTGSKPAAEAKKTVFYLGGEASVVAEAEPVLQRISAQCIHIGTPEQACTIKLAMNLQIAAQMQALSEALYLSRRAGVADDLFFTCMKGNASWSGLAALKEPKLRAGDISPQFSVKHLLKDLKLIRAMGEDLSALSMMIDQLEQLAASGHSEQDFSALYHQIASKTSTP